MVDEVWNKGDETAIDRLFHPDAIVHGLPTPDGAPIRGPEAFKPFYRRFKTAFPNIRIELLDVVESGDTAIAHCRVIATHAGDALGVPATNRNVTFEAFTRTRVRDGKIVEGWNTFDFMGMYQQLGMQFDLPGG